MFGSFGGAATSTTTSGGLFGASALGTNTEESKAPVAAAPPMFNASVKPPAAFPSAPIGEPKKEEKTSLFGAAAPATAGSMFGSFASAAPSTTTYGGLFGASTLGATTEEVKVSVAPSTIETNVKPSASLAVEPEPVVTPSKSKETKYPDVKLDTSLEKLFEEELKAWEAMKCDGLPVTLSVSDSDHDSSESNERISSLKDRLLNVRECVRSMDEEVRILYTSDSVSVGEESRRIQGKCEDMHQRLESLMRDMKRVLRNYKPKGIGRTSQIRQSDTLSPERVTPREYGIYKTTLKESSPLVVVP